MPIATLNGVDLNYEIDGQGKAVVFLHGYTGSIRDWDNQMRVLSPQYQIIALDIRGHGKSAAPSREEGYSLEIFVDDVYGLLKLLDIEKCYLVGHSLGGIIALQFALEHKDMLAALVLVDTSSEQIELDPNYVELTQTLHEIARSEGMEAAFEYDATHNPQKIELFKKYPELKEVKRQRMQMTSVDAYTYIPKAWSNWKSLTPRLSEINVPTLIYLGEEDLPFANAAQILKREIAKSELVMVRGVGHSPQEESPRYFNDKLLAFLNGIKW